MPAWLTPLTATLIHGGIAHLALNLVMLVYCGLFAERALGAAGVVILYIVGAYAAALGHWAFEPGSSMPMIGASGAISAVVGAYAVEGHVPAGDVDRLLRERPAARALSAPGMPAGSPGMEAAGREPYTTMLILNDGSTRVFGRHNGA